MAQDFQMDQTITADIIRTSELFDEDWYRHAYPDVAQLGIDPALHYVRYGARLGRNPSPDFNTRFYLISNPSLATSDVNPLLHFLTSKPDDAARLPHPPGDVGRLCSAVGTENRPAPKKTPVPESPVDLVRPYFDASFYENQGACVPAGSDPVEHFLTVGWRIGLSPARWFDPLGYTTLHKHVARSGINPFLHFIRHGLAARAAPNPYFQDRHHLRHPDLQRLGPSEYGPISHILKYCESEAGVPQVPSRICVHVHAFYMDMLGDVCTVIGRIPAPFTLLISIPEGQDATHVRLFFEDRLDMATKVVVRAVPNRGRDVAPWVVHFRDEVIESDIFCHFHTKRSAHAGDHKYWFRFLCHSILGSRDIAAQILGMFAEDEKLGLVSPAYWAMLRRQPNFGQAKTEFDRLLARLGVSGRYDICPDYPTGSFFWCRTRILRPLMNAGLELADFPEERGQICGTIGHALERAIGVFPAEAGMRTAFVAADWSHELAEQRPLKAEFTPEELGMKPLPSISVIVPTWNRGPSLIRALNSIFAQTISPAQVIVVDDGSTDGTASLVKRTFAEQIRRRQLRLIAAEHKGVSAARNAGLEAATGDIIAYLDSDNTWRPEYLAHVAAAFARHPNALSAYADFLMHDADRGCAETYRQDYDRAALLHRNFIDLNVFSHRRSLVEQGQRFDLGLKRLVDWDFIIGVTFHRAPVHIDYVGADYHLDKTSLNNITYAVPLRENMARVNQKHRRERVFYRQEPLSIAIKCPAPMRDAARGWGDLYFATSLCSALERLGCRTRIDLLEAWETEKGEKDDVVIVLRGLSRYKPKPQHINLMWHISHPDKVSVEEMREFDHVFVASYHETKALHSKLGTKVSTLLQCSDPELFGTETPSRGVPAHDLLFVGNSRGVDRWMPTTCVDHDLPVTVYGQGWENRLPESVIGGRHVRNQQLAAYYRSAKVVLNDHWPDMARRGFISNRIFDAGLSGSLVISDEFDGNEIFFGSVVTCRDGTDFERKARFFLGNEPARKALADRLRQIVTLSHTFDHRARELVRVARQTAAARLGLPTGAPSTNLDIAAVPFPSATESGRRSAR